MKHLLFFIIFIQHGISWCSSWGIVANGLPLPIDELQISLFGKKTLFLDGAVNRFKPLSPYPDCILGDFDSIEDPSYWGILATFLEIDELSPAYEGNFGITIIPAKDQNYTDLEKGIIYCDGVGATSIVVLQATGKRMDHTLGNLRLLKKYYKPNRTLLIETDHEQIMYLCNESIALEGGVGEYCAMMGYPQAVMKTSGLLYNGSGYPLQMGVQDSICNTISEPKSTISIQGEALVILPKSSRVLKLGTY